MMDQEPLSTLKDNSSPAADHARTVAGRLPRSRDDADPATSRNRAAAPVICHSAPATAPPAWTPASSATRSCQRERHVCSSSPLAALPVEVRPQAVAGLTDRDLAALRWIGEGFEVTQFLVRLVFFSGRSEAVVSRRVRRWFELGYVAIDRWRLGPNRLRLTARGRAMLATCGAARAEDLFAPPHPVAAKDVEHTFWINAVRAVLHAGTVVRPELLLPAWLLQRRLRPAPPAIPDLLAVRVGSRRSQARALAFEIDLGSEGLRRVVLPKCRLLADWLRANFPEVPTAIVLLARSQRRCTALEVALVELALDIPLAVAVLPSPIGPAAVAALRALMAPPGATSHCSLNDSATYAIPGFLPVASVLD